MNNDELQDGCIENVPIQSDRIVPKDELVAKIREKESDIPGSINASSKDNPEVTFAEFVDMI